MSFTGLGLANVLLAGAAASVVAVLLYLLRPRQRVFVVPFAPLWESVLAGREPRALFRRLRGLFGLLLVLAVLWLIACALGRPVLGKAKGEHDALVVAVDVSASMGARQGARSSMDEARKAARKVVSASPRASIALVALDNTVNVLAPFTGNRREILKGIEALEASSCPGRLAETLETASALAEARRARIVLIGDSGTARQLDGVPASAKMSFINVAGDRENVGIVNFTMRSSPGGHRDYETMLHLASFARDDRDFTVRIFKVDAGTEMLLDAVGVSLRAGEEKTLFFPSFADVAGRIVARLCNADGLPIEDALDADNEAYIYASRPAPLRVLLVTTGNLFLESALAADAGVLAEKTGPADFTGGSGYDVVIFDGRAEVSRGGAPTIELPRDEEIAKLPEESRIVPGRIEVRRDHPIFSGVSMRDITVARARKLSLGAGDVVLAESPAGEPLIVETRSGGSRAVVFAFDPCACEWPVRAAFPLFWANLVRVTADRWLTRPFASVKCGSDYVLGAQLAANEVAFTAPDGSTGSLRGAAGAALPCRQIGFYEIVSDGEASYVGSNLFDREESDLRREGPPARSASSAAGLVASSPLSVDPWRTLVVLAVGVVLFEWFTYTRRLTV